LTTRRWEKDDEDGGQKGRAGAEISGEEFTATPPVIASRGFAAGGTGILSWLGSLSQKKDWLS